MPWRLQPIRSLESCCILCSIPWVVFYGSFPVFITAFTFPAESLYGKRTPFFIIQLSLNVQTSMKNQIILSNLAFYSLNLWKTWDGKLYADVEEFAKQRLKNQEGGENSFGLCHIHAKQIFWNKNFQRFNTAKTTPGQPIDRAVIWWLYYTCKTDREI